MIIKPNRLSLGELISVETIKTAATQTNKTGTTGYPSVRYGRSRSGRRILSTITDAAAIAYRIQLGKITRVYRLSYCPLSRRTADHALSSRIEIPGVRYFSETYAYGWKK